MKNVMLDLRICEKEVLKGRMTSFHLAGSSSIRIIKQQVKYSDSIVLQFFVHIHYSLHKHVQRGETKADFLAF